MWVNNITRPRQVAETYKEEKDFWKSAREQRVKQIAENEPNKILAIKKEEEKKER